MQKQLDRLEMSSTSSDNSTAKSRLCTLAEKYGDNLQNLTEEEAEEFIRSIKDAKMVQFIEKTARLAVRPAAIRLNNGGKEWCKVEGCLDAGSDDTFLSWEIHRASCYDVKPLDIPVRVRIANNVYCYAKHGAKVNIRLNDDLYINNVDVLLVEGEWPDALIGKPVLELLQALPEQNLPQSGNYNYAARKAELVDTGSDLIKGSSFYENLNWE
jgi:hypothetical protein